MTRDEPSITQGLELKETFLRTHRRSIFIGRGEPDRDEAPLHLPTALSPAWREQEEEVLTEELVPTATLSVLFAARPEKKP